VTSASSVPVREASSPIPGMGSKEPGSTCERSGGVMPDDDDDREWHDECNRRSDANMRYWFTGCATCGHERSRHSNGGTGPCASSPATYTDVTECCACDVFVEPEEEDD
jgi:hypothetical protein